MDFPWLPLAFNLALLGSVLLICHRLNEKQGTLEWNGALVFLVLCLSAMLLDFALTMVFASASFHERTEYESLASRKAWVARILTYVIPCAVSLLLAWRFRRRQRFARELARGGSSNGRDESVRIQTSPYTESELTL